MVTENRSGCLGPGIRKWELSGNGHKETDGSILLDCGDSDLVYIFVKTHQNVCLKLVHFIHENYISS